jgi:hypothetical protein
MNIKEEQFGDLEKAILRTLAFFDIFNYPLTLIEIYKWLYGPKSGLRFSLADVLKALENENLKKYVENKNGFYFFSGRSGIIKIRLNRYRLAEKKFRLARQAIWWLSWLPFIKTTCICNNLGYNNSDGKSDIDVFIIVKAGHLWQSRLLITLLLGGLGFWRHGQKVIDRICLSFYLSDQNLDLESIAINQEDIYLVYWLAVLAPVYQPGNYLNFLKANIWLKEKLANFYPVILAGRRVIDDFWLKSKMRNFFEFILTGYLGRVLEKFAKLIQLKKMAGNNSSAVNQPEHKVIVNDRMLKFHENDRRQEYFKRWQQKLNDLRI